MHRSCFETFGKVFVWDLQVSIPFHIALWNIQLTFFLLIHIDSYPSENLNVCIWDAIARYGYCSFSFSSYHGPTAPSIGALHWQIFKILDVIVLPVTSTFLLYVGFMLNNFKFINKKYNFNVSMFSKL